MKETTEFTPSTAKLGAEILEVAEECIAAGLVLPATGVPLLDEMRKRLVLDALPEAACVWALREIEARAAPAPAAHPIVPIEPAAPGPAPRESRWGAKGAEGGDGPAFPVWCGRCDKPVDEVLDVLPGKVYVACHDQRQGIPRPEGATELVAFQ